MSEPTSPDSARTGGSRLALIPLWGVTTGAVMGFSTGLHQIGLDRYAELGLPNNLLIVMRRQTLLWSLTALAVAAALAVAVWLSQRLSRRSTMASGSGLLWWLASPPALIAAVWLLHTATPPFTWPLSSSGSQVVLMALLVLLLVAGTVAHARNGRWQTVLMAVCTTATALILIGSSLAWWWARVRPRQDRPNVVLLIVDTLRFDHLSCFGGRPGVTPSLDRLAQESLVYRNAISAAPWTSPAVAAMLTGVNPTTLGYNANHHVRLGDHVVTLAEVLREHGYHTHCLVSHILASFLVNLDQGFDTFDDSEAGGEEYISSPGLLRKSLSRVRGAAGQPFFLLVHWFDPHFDYLPHPGYDYDPAYQGRISNVFNILHLRDMAADLSARDLDHLRARYDSEISFTDAHVGKLLEELRTLGLYDDTLLILVSDHGEEFSERGDHHLGHTTTLFQELVHVPLMIKLPHHWTAGAPATGAPAAGAPAAGTPAAGTIDGYYGTIDLMPTVLRILGLQLPAGYSTDAGVLPLASGDRAERPVFSRTSRLVYRKSVLWQGWKLHHDEKAGSYQLYDLANDPGERTNLAGQGLEIEGRLRDLLGNWHLDAVQRATRYNPEPIFLDDETKAKLRALGYL